MSTEPTEIQRLLPLARIDFSVLLRGDVASVLASSPLT